MKSSNRPTPEQAAEFDGYVAEWQRLLNLMDWRIERSAKPTKDAMADITFLDSARLAVYRLGDFGPESITADSLNKTALHEVLHVFLHELVSVAQNPITNAEQLDAAEHRVINVLEKVLGDKCAERNLF